MMIGPSLREAISASAGRFVRIRESDANEKGALSRAFASRHFAPRSNGPSALVTPSTRRRTS